MDAITGAIRSGSYSVQVVDAVTGSNGTGTIRFLTNKLEDANYQQQLLSRRAYLYVSSNEGVSWTQMYAGYVSGIRLVSAATFEIGIADSRRVEQTRTIFTGNTLGTFTTRGCLTGGPVTKTWGPVVSRGGWYYKVSSIPGNQNILLNFLAGYDSFANSPVVSDWKKLIRQSVVDEISKSTRIITETSLGYPVGYGDIVMHVGTTDTNAVPTSHILLANEYGQAYSSPGYGPLSVWWSNPATIPANNSYLYVSLYTRNVSQACPLYIDAHPVDIVTQIWDEARMYWKDPAAPDPAWVAQIRALIGVDTRLAIRLTEPPVISKFLEETIFGPFGISARVNSTSGALELIDIRGRGTGTPAVTITAADMSNGSDVVFDLDESTAISTVSLTAQLFSTNYTAKSADVVTNTTPTDGVLVNDVKAVGYNGDTTVFAGREVSFTVRGMIHNADSWLSAESAMLQSIAVPIYSRFGRGAQAANVSIIGTSSAASLQVGDECIFAAPHYPNANYRVGESTVGGRIMQVIRRTETPTGPQLRILDVGLNQPSAPIPLVSVRKSPTQGAYAAEFKLDNAGLMAAAFLSVEVEWTTGASSPTSGGTTFNVYGPADIPTGYVTLPTVPPGTTVWVRARSKAYQRRASAWTSWYSVALDALNAPSGFSIPSVTSSSASLQWTNTNANWPISVYLYQGVSAPALWNSYKVATIGAGTTNTVIRDGIVSGLPYVVAVAYDTPNGSSLFATQSFTATGSTSTLLRPAAMDVVAGSSDASLAQGVALALWASNTTYNIAVYRAPDSGGAPGSYELLSVVNGNETLYIDYLAQDGVTYWYAIAHRLGGFTESALTPAVSAQASGVTSGLVRPSAVAPTITPETAGSATLDVTIAVTDPQGRVDKVEFRTKNSTNPFGPWTQDTSVPYSASVAKGTASDPSIIEWRVWGFTSENSYTILRSGSSEWPLYLGTNPTINRLTRSRFNSATNRYEVWGRYFLDNGDGTFTEDPLLGFVTIFAVINVKSQSGATATVTTHTPKEADGWRFSWPSAATDQWTFELTSYGLAETLYFPGQNPDVQDKSLPTVQGSATFIAPASQSSGGTGDVVGPSSATDNALVRFDGTTGKLIKNSSATLTDAGTLTTTTGAFTNLSSTNTITGSISGNAATVTNGVYTTGSYANPSWIASLGWSKITGTPTTTSGYGITDAITTANIGSQSVNYANTAGSASTATSASSVPWSGITSKPTTLSGFGITDGVSTGGSYANPSWLTSLAWSKITGTPTTIAGYGITDAVSTSGSYADPSWITSLAGSKITGNISGSAANVTGVVAIANGGTNQTAYATSGTGTRVLVYDQGLGKFDVQVAGASGQFLRSSGTTGDVLWATPPNFTSTTAGYAPASGGGTTNFLRADGTWAAPPSTTTISANNVTAGTFPGTLYTFAGSARITEDLIVDTNTFVVDSVNNRVGVGTATPVSRLQVNGGKIVFTSDDGAYGQAQINAPSGGEATLLFGSTGSGQNSGGYTNAGVVGIGAYGNTRDILVLGTGYAGGTIYLKNGDVGIGSNSPSGKLEVFGGTVSNGTAQTISMVGSGGANSANYNWGITSKGDTNWGFRVQNPSNGAYYTDVTGAWGANAAGGFRVIDKLSGTENVRMLVNGSGNVAIGPHTPAVLLDVGGTIRTRNGAFQLHDGTSQGGGLFFYKTITGGGSNLSPSLFSETGMPLYFMTNGSASIKGTLSIDGNWTVTGNVVAYSDARVKENVRVIDNALARVRAIRGVTFTRTDMQDTAKRHAGVIAQEVEAVLPEVISDNDDGMKSVAYGNITALLIEAIKELQDEVTALRGMMKT